MLSRHKGEWGGLPDRLRDAGLTVLAIDLRGHGKTESLCPSITALDNLRDASEAYDFLASRSDVFRPRASRLAASS